MKKIDSKSLAVQRALWHHIRAYTRARHEGTTTDLTFKVSAALREIQKVLPPEKYPTKNSSSLQRMIARMIAGNFIVDLNEEGRGKDLRVNMAKLEEVQSWPLS